MVKRKKENEIGSEEVEKKKMKGWRWPVWAVIAVMLATAANTRTASKIAAHFVNNLNTCHCPSQVIRIHFHFPKPKKSIVFKSVIAFGNVFKMLIFKIIFRNESDV